MDHHARRQTPPDVRPRIEESTVRRVVSAVVALAGLLVVLGLVAVLPGVDRLLDALAVAPQAVALALATGLVAGALVWVAPTVAPVFETFDLGGLYDLAFLTVGVVLGAFVRRFYRCWAPVTDLVTDFLVAAYGTAGRPDATNE